MAVSALEYEVRCRIFETPFPINLLKPQDKDGTEAYKPTDKIEYKPNDI